LYENPADISIEMYQCSHTFIFACATGTRPITGVMPNSCGCGHAQQVRARRQTNICACHLAFVPLRCLREAELQSPRNGDRGQSRMQIRAGKVAQMRAKNGKKADPEQTPA
jgi:hypothetical protein